MKSYCNVGMTNVSDPALFYLTILQKVQMHSRAFQQQGLTDSVMVDDADNGSLIYQYSILWMLIKQEYAQQIHHYSCITHSHTQFGSDGMEPIT